MKEKEKEIYDFIIKKKRCNMPEIISELNIGADIVLKIVKQLREQGYIEPIDDKEYNDLLKEFGVFAPNVAFTQDDPAWLLSAQTPLSIF